MSRALAVLAVVIAAAAGGAFVAEAATPSTSVRACETSKGLLTLAGKRGHCASGNRGVSLNQKGPRGATGKTGPAGTPGRDGVGATSAALDLTYPENFPPLPTPKTVGTFAGYVITISCNADFAELFFTGTKATQDLYIHGTADVSGSAYTSTNDIPQGSSPIDTEVAAHTAFFIEAGSDGSGYTSDVSAHLLLLAGPATAALDLYEYAAPTNGGQVRCQDDAQLTPSSTQAG